MAEGREAWTLIMAGGVGTRFWPLSRKAMPKQLLSLDGGPSMLLRTVRRALMVSAEARILVVTNEELVELVREELSAYPSVRVVGEPSGRNTAPCIGLACAMVSALDGDDAVLVALPADHFIGDDAAFARDLHQAVSIAENDAIATIGIPPTHPETGYGYLETLAPEERVAEVESFCEKPDRATAQRWLAAGTHLWNAGIFAFRARVMLDEFAAHLPVVARTFQRLTADFTTVPDLNSSDFRDAWNALPSISIDYAVMEHAARVRMVRASFPWSDVGSWDAVASVIERDESGNIARGDVMALECEDCVFFAEGGRRLAALGLSGMVVVDTPDAVLVVPRTRSQDVRKVVDALKRRANSSKDDANLL